VEFQSWRRGSVSSFTSPIDSGYMIVTPFQCGWPLLIRNGFVYPWPCHPQ
jgi:hypothetical protein